MEKLPIEQLPGVGPKTFLILKKLGINTCEDLKKMRDYLLNHYFGIYGIRLKEFASGRGSDEVIPNDLQGLQSSIGNSETFEKDIYKADEFKRKLYEIADQVGIRLREQNLSAQVLHLIIRFKNFVTQTQQITCNYSFNDTPTIYRLALRLSEGVNIRRGIRLIGIRLSKLTPFRQQKLFKEKITSAELINTIDYLNRKWGKTLIKPLDV
jgi:DNA polymerase-4